MLAESRLWFLVPQEAAVPVLARSSCGCALTAAVTLESQNMAGEVLEALASLSAQTQQPRARLVSAANSGPKAENRLNLKPFFLLQTRQNLISAPTSLCLRP